MYWRTLGPGLEAEFGPGGFEAMQGDAGDEPVLFAGFGAFSLKIKGISLRQYFLGRADPFQFLGGGTGLFDFRLIQGPATRATGHEISSFLAML